MREKTAVGRGLSTLLASSPLYSVIRTLGNHRGNLLLLCYLLRLPSLLDFCMLQFYTNVYCLDLSTVGSHPRTQADKYSSSAQQEDNNRFCVSERPLSPISYYSTTILGTTAKAYDHRVLAIIRSCSRRRKKKKMII